MNEIFYIVFFGFGCDGYVGVDNGPTNDFDSAIHFNSFNEAEDFKNSVQNDWASLLEVCKFSF